MNQFPDLFPGTIYENVQIADLTASQEQIVGVLKRAGIWEMKDQQLNGSRDEISGGEQKKDRPCKIAAEKSRASHFR